MPTVLSLKISHLRNQNAKDSMFPNINCVTVETFRDSIRQNIKLAVDEFSSSPAVLTLCRARPQHVSSPPERSLAPAGHGTKIDVSSSRDETRGHVTT